MMRIFMRKLYLRPIKSPSRPKNKAPNGRTKNSSANASNAKTLRVASGKDEKNCAQMMAASEPCR